MTSGYLSSGYSVPHQPYVPSHTIPPSYLHFACQNAPAGESASAPKSVHSLDYLSYRIAVLESEIAQALSDKAAAEHAAQYLLRLVAAADRQKQMISLDNNNNSELHHQIRQLKFENATLLGELREATTLRGNAVNSKVPRWDPIDALDPSYGPRCSCLSADAKAPCPVPPTSSTIADLIDIEDEPAADSSTASLPSEDELNDYSQAPPRIDLVTNARGSCQAATNCTNDGLIGGSDLAPIRRFSSGNLHITIRTDNIAPHQKEHFFLQPQPSIASVQETQANGFIDKDITEGVYSRFSTTVISQVPRLQMEHCMDTPEESFEDSDSVDRGFTSLAERQPTKWNTSVNEDRPEQTALQATCGLNKLFATRAIYANAIRKHKYSAGAEERQFPDLFRYGLQYQPAADQTDVFQTLSIHNLPAKLSLQELMSKIRGGIVVSCQLFNTSSMTGSWSALLRFLHESDALAYDDFASANPITFRGQRANVSSIRTPSWPLSLPYHTAIFEHQHTRCLEVTTYPRSIQPIRLARDLRLHRGSIVNAIEYMCMRKDGVLELRFSSIFHAGRAYGMLSTWRAYRTCRVSFAKDPCALPLNTLKDAMDTVPAATMEQGPQLVGHEYDNLVADEMLNLLSVVNSENGSPKEPDTCGRLSRPVSQQ